MEVQFTEYGICTLWSGPRFESTCEGSAEIAGSSAQSVMSSILKIVLLNADRTEEMVLNVCVVKKTRHKNGPFYRTH